jgi:ATP-binding cassette subfamily F protein 3
MDEPTNHLDLVSKEVLKQALAQYDGTLLVVSHDRDFLKELTDTVYEILPNRLKTWKGDVIDFLKEKKAESIAVYEQAQVVKKSVATESNVEKVSTKEEEKEKKKQQQQLARLENQIQELEEQVFLGL